MSNSINPEDFGLPPLDELLRRLGQDDSQGKQPVSQFQEVPHESLGIKYTCETLKSKNGIGTIEILNNGNVVCEYCHAPGNPDVNPYCLLNYTETDFGMGRIMKDYAACPFAGNDQRGMWKKGRDPYQD